jgi:peptidyl-prolyl cis-trans isomerase D
MRRLALVVAVLALSGCSALRDAFSAQPAAAGSALGESLSVERLADMAGHAKRVPLRIDVLAGLASVYLDYAVFAMDLARGRDLDDSTLVLAAEWPAVSQARQVHFHERLIAARGEVTVHEADSVYRVGAARVFQHILVRVPRNATAGGEREKQARAAALRRQLEARHGAGFAQFAQRYSEDSGTQARGGYLVATGPGQFVRAFDSTAWQLEPGAMSDVVRSPYGFHIIRRPTLAEVRDTLMASLETVRTAHFDSLYLDSLMSARKLTVLAAAPALVRQAVPQLMTARDDSRALARYRGGTFRVKDFVRRLLALNPEDLRGITSASDGQLRLFVRQVAQLELVAQQAESASVALTPGDWRQIRAAHDSTLGRLKAVTGLSPRLLQDSAATAPERTRLAMTHVDKYFDRALAEGPGEEGRHREELAFRQGASWSLNDAGVARALERAQGIRAAADSGTTGAPATGLKPARGPAPAPPDTAPRTAR